MFSQVAYFPRGGNSSRQRLRYQCDEGFQVRCNAFSTMDLQSSAGGQQDRNRPPSGPIGRFRVEAQHSMPKVLASRKLPVANNLTLIPHATNMMGWAEAVLALRSLVYQPWAEIADRWNDVSKPVAR